MSGQPCFPGFEAFFRPAWKPNAHTLARVKNYLEGFAAHSREIRWKLRTAADRLEMGRSTLCRYLRWLRDENWLATIKVTMRYAIRKVLATVKLASSSGTPFGTPIEVKPEASQNPLKQNTTNAPSSGGEPSGGAQSSQSAASPDPSGLPRSTGGRENPKPGGGIVLPLGYSPQFQEYIGIFFAAGKAMNVHDVKRAHAAWIGIGPHQWQPAFEHAQAQLLRTRSAMFVPMPVNHLLDEGWTRVAPERTLPIVVDKQPTRGAIAQDNAAQRFLARFK